MGYVDSQLSVAVAVDSSPAWLGCCHSTGVAASALASHQPLGFLALANLGFAMEVDDGHCPIGVEASAIRMSVDSWGWVVGIAASLVSWADDVGAGSLDWVAVSSG